MFGVNLRETLATGIVPAKTIKSIKKLFPSIYRLVNNLLEEFFKHGVVDQFRSGAVHFDDFFLVRIERVKGAELAAAVAEQN